MKHSILFRSHNQRLLVCRNLWLYSCRCNTKKSDHLIIELGSRSQKYQGDFGTSDPKKKFQFSSLIFLVIPATTFGLGCWQVQRLKWKLDLIEQIKNRMNAPPIDFPIDDLSNIINYEYTRVKLEGHFLYEKQITIGPRIRFDKAAKTSDNPANQEYGYHVITPFEIDGTDKIIMVNRGWHPNDEAPGGPKETLSFEGFIRKDEKKGAFGYENDPDKNIWYYKNGDQMALKLGTLPIFVDASYESTTFGGPIGGQTNVALRNQHLAYLLTWFGLTLATMYLWKKRFFKR